MWTYNYPNELQHYGVLGMKWGVRKEYVRKGEKNKLSKEEKRRKIKKIVAIAGGVTLAAAAIAVAGYTLKKRNMISDIMSTPSYSWVEYESLKNESDIFLSKGSKLHRVSSVKETDFRGDRLYASFDKNDIRRYKVLFEQHLKTKELFDVSLTALNDIKAPSNKKQYDLFVDMIKNNTGGFADSFVSTQFKYASKGMEEIKDPEALAKYRYNGFITGLMNRDNPTGKIFINNMKNLGYNALFDANDAGSYSKSPLIALDPDTNLAIEFAKKISLGEKFTATLLAKSIK